MFPVRLIVIAGPAGSGKSTLANVVAEDLGVPHLDFDTVSRKIMAIRQEENPELSEPRLLEIFKSERYSELAGAIRDCSWDFIWLHLDPEIRMRRIIGRDSPRDARVRNYGHGRESFFSPLIAHRVVDAGEEIDAQCREVIRTIL